MTEKARIMRSLVERAMRGAELLPVSELADLNDAAALALQRYDSKRAACARHTSGLLRQAAAQQLEFSALLRS